MYFMTILLHRNCTSSYESDEIVRFSALRSEMLDFWKLKKYSMSVKNYFQTKFESSDLIYQPRGIQKCNKMGGIADSTKRYCFWKKSLMNRSGVFYSYLKNLWVYSESILSLLWTCWEPVGGICLNCDRTRSMIWSRWLFAGCKLLCCFFFLVLSMYLYSTWLPMYLRAFVHNVRLIALTNLWTDLHTYLRTNVPTYLHTYVPTYLHTYIIYEHSLVLSMYLCIVPAYLCTYMSTYL